MRNRERRAFAGAKEKISVECHFLCASNAFLPEGRPGRCLNPSREAITPYISLSSNASLSPNDGV